MPVWDLGGVWRHEDISLPDYLSEDELDSLPALLLVLLLVAVLCIVYRFLRCRTRPRRKRQTRLRRLMTSIRVPAVWSVAPSFCSWRQSCVLLIASYITRQRQATKRCRSCAVWWHSYGSWLRELLSCLLEPCTALLVVATLCIVCCFQRHKQHLSLLLTSSWCPFEWRLHSLYHTSCSRGLDVKWTFVIQTLISYFSALFFHLKREQLQWPRPNVFIDFQDISYK